MDEILMKSLLYDFYGGLLTGKQSDYYEMYYFENLTLMEIGDELGVSPQAVRDIIRRTEKKLMGYEDKLGHVAKYLHRRQAADKLIEALDSLSGFTDKSIINEIKDGIRQLVIDNY